MLRHLYFREYRCVFKKAFHTSRGGVAEIREDYITAEKVARVVCNISSEKVRKYESHYQKVKKRRKQAPKHAEVGSLIFLFEISFHKLGEKEPIALDFRKHFTPYGTPCQKET